MKQSAKQTKPKKQYYAVIPADILNSAAFRALPAGYAHYVYVIIRSKLVHVRDAIKGKPGKRSSQYRVFTYREANERGISRGGFNTAKRQLADVGLIDIRHQGGGAEGDASVIALSDRWKRYGKPDFVKQVKVGDLNSGVRYVYETAASKPVTDNPDHATDNPDHGGKRKLIK
jgi:hypothetical protein